ncbi:MAG TPA: LacI family DNA-binding transcriptional regulator [Microbacterium sp.]|nr:LacI family DNA-binding transcriptional regulator [Microbacterium sp.]
MATASDVARLAGVSQSTVSYVMSGTRSISPATRARVEAAMRELSYHPNAGARALAGRRTNVIGLVASLPGTNDVAALIPFVETISTFCRDRDYDVVLVTADEGPAGLERLAGRAIVDAIVLMDIRRDDERVATARELSVPVVLIGIPSDPNGLDCVDHDVPASGTLAVQELIAAGCTRVLLVGDDPATRTKGFGFVTAFGDSVRQASRDHAISFDEYLPHADGWPGFSDLGDRLDPSGGRLGIVARTPQAIDITMQTLQLRGLAPGTDVAMVGGCTDDTAEGFRYPVTNVSPEPQAVSELAMKTLFGRLAGDDSERRVQLVSPRLTRRATTAPFIS